MTTNVTTPVIYALGTVTTIFSFVIAICISTALLVQRRRARRPSDAGGGLV